MGAGLSAGAIVAIVFNGVIAFLLLLLFLILCKACRTPACPDQSPSSETDERGNEEKYLLQA
nr:adropin [Pogona vitticeps]